MLKPSWLALTVVAGIVAASTLGGCAAARGTRPDDMSAVLHEQEAQKAEAAAAEEDAPDPVPDRSAGERRALAREYRASADAHRAAARELEARAARACAGVSHAAAAPDGGWLRRAERVDALREQSTVSARGYAPILLKGASITLPAGDVAALSELEKAIECHVAQTALKGDLDPAMADCPLAVKGVSTKLRSGNGGAVLLEIRAPTEKAASEVLRRAQGLTAPRA